MTSSPDARVTVRYAVTFDYRTFHGEDELSVPDSALVQRVRSKSILEGRVEISAPGQPDVRIADELVPWIQNLCFRAVPSLATGQPERIQYFSRSGYVLLTPSQDAVELSGDRDPHAVYPRKALLEALVDCGDRFLAFADAVKRDDADFMAQVNYARRFAAQAREALQDTGEA